MLTDEGVISIRQRKMATRNVAAVRIMSSEDKTEVVE